MGLTSMLTGKWFTRLVLVSCVVCSISIYVVFKNMEFIVHGQLYDFGLIFSPEWADGYRVFTWLVFACVGVPLALSSLALASSFLHVAEVPERKHVAPQRTGPPRGVTKVGYIGSKQTRPVQQSRPVQQTRQAQEPVRQTISRVDNGNCVGIVCPECKKVFGRALVMLDFRSGSNRMVSVCPYCNHVLGYTSDEKANSDGFRVGSPDKKILR